MEASVNFSKETGGAFDVTVGPYTDLWRTSRNQGQLPPPDTLSTLKNQVGWEYISMQADGQRVLLRAPRMKIDLGGIAKGYILDEAVKTLENHDVYHALIEAGGDIRVSGPPPGQRGWNIDVPDAPENEPVRLQAASLQYAAIATSGDTEQYVVIEGRRYSHTINPKTGLGLTTRRKATVIAPDGITADRFATALTVMDSTAAAGSSAKIPARAGIHQVCTLNNRQTRGCLFNSRALSLSGAQNCS